MIYLLKLSKNTFHKFSILAWLYLLLLENHVLWSIPEGREREILMKKLNLSGCVTVRKKEKKKL